MDKTLSLPSKEKENFLSRPVYSSGFYVASRHVCTQENQSLWYTSVVVVSRARGKFIEVKKSGMAKSEEEADRSVP